MEHFIDPLRRAVFISVTVSDLPVGYRDPPRLHDLRMHAINDVRRRHLRSLFFLWDSYPRCTQMSSCWI